MPRSSIAFSHINFIIKGGAQVPFAHPLTTGLFNQFNQWEGELLMTSFQVDRVYKHVHMSLESLRLYGTSNGLH